MQYIRNNICIYTGTLTLLTVAIVITWYSRSMHGSCVQFYTRASGCGCGCLLIWVLATEMEDAEDMKEGEWGFGP